MEETNFVLKKLLYKYDYLECYMEEVKFKYSKYNSQFLKEYYELNPIQQDSNLCIKKDYDEINKADPVVDSLEETQEQFKETQNDQNKNENKVESEEQEQENKQEDPMLNEILNKLYKKLSLKTHPDKHGGNNELFIELLNAYNSKNILKLIKMAHNLEIDYVLSDVLILYIEKDIIKLENKINELQHHVCWLWCNADDETKKKFKLP